MPVVKMTDYNQWSNPINRAERTRCFDDEFQYIVTTHGIVVSWRLKGHALTRLEFVWTGRHFVRVWEREWGDKTISRLAREMAEEITNRFPGG